LDATVIEIANSIQLYKKSINHKCISLSGGKYKEPKPTQTNLQLKTPFLSTETMMTGDLLDFDTPSTPTVERTDGTITTSIVNNNSNDIETTSTNPDIGVQNGHSILEDLEERPTDPSPTGPTSIETVTTTSSNLGLDLISGGANDLVVTETNTLVALTAVLKDGTSGGEKLESTDTTVTSTVLDEQHGSTNLLDFGEPVVPSGTSATALEAPGGLIGATIEPNAQQNLPQSETNLLDLMMEPTTITTSTSVDISDVNPPLNSVSSDLSLENKVDISEGVPNGYHDAFKVFDQGSESQPKTNELLSDPFNNTVSSGVSTDESPATTTNENTIVESNGSNHSIPVTMTTRLDEDAVDGSAQTMPTSTNNSENNSFQEVTMGSLATTSATLQQDDVAKQAVDNVSSDVAATASVVVDTKAQSSIIEQPATPSAENGNQEPAGGNDLVRADMTAFNSDDTLSATTTTTNELIVDCIDSSHTTMPNRSTSDGPSWLHNDSNASDVPNDTTIPSQEQVPVVQRGGQEDTMSKSVPSEASSSLPAIAQPAHISQSPMSVDAKSIISRPTLPVTSDSTNMHSSSLPPPSTEGHDTTGEGVLPSNSSSSECPHQPTPAKEDFVDADPLSANRQVELLQRELAAAQTLIVEFQRREDDEKQKQPNDEILLELRVNLQNEINLRTETEVKVQRMTGLHEQLQVEYDSFKEESASILHSIKHDLEVLSQERSNLAKEVEQIREERDEQARKEMSLTTRLNAAKKKEALKSNAAEHYEDQVDQLERQVTDYKVQLESMTVERDQLGGELAEWKQYAERRTKQLETALGDEKKLNDERKRKMKGFVEAKTEEVRSAKSDNISLQTELDQTTHSLKELNQRYKQLHAQWVQSQTRNRELQRDATKMKMDSEKMHKVGGTLEARLSRSAQESEDHKHKRIQAKHELMSVLSQLEAERSVNNRVRESIKMTFTPKALSQQQTIQETMDDLEAALHKLSTRLGRPLVPPPTSTVNDLAMEALNGDDGGTLGIAGGSTGDFDGDNDEGKSSSGGNTLSDVNTNRVLQKLENETQRVSQSIVALSTSVERLHAMLEGGGARNCVGALQAILGGNNRSSDETRSITGNARLAPTRNGPRYGQISGSLT
jgi:hypothetical protein